MNENLPTTDLEFPEFAHEPQHSPAKAVPLRILTPAEQLEERNRMIAAAFFAGSERSAIARVFGVTETTVLKVCRAALASRGAAALRLRAA